MGGGGCNVCMRERRRVEASSHETRKVCHVDEEVCANAVCDFAHFSEVDDARDSRTTCDDHLRLVFGGKSLDLVVVDLAVLLANAVLDRVEPFARLVRLCAVGQVAASVERHAEDGVTRLEESLEHALVRLRTRVRLNVCEFTVEQLFCAFDREGFSDVYVFAAAVVTLTSITFGVFVGHYRALGFHHSFGYDVFRSNQFNLVTLTAQFRANGGKKIGVTGFKAFGEKTSVGGSHTHVLRVGDWIECCLGVLAARGKSRKRHNHHESEAKAGKGAMIGDIFAHRQLWRCRATVPLLPIDH